MKIKGPKFGLKIKGPKFGGKGKGKGPKVSVSISGSLSGSFSFGKDPVPLRVGVDGDFENHYVKCGHGHLTLFKKKPGLGAKGCDNCLCNAQFLSEPQGDDVVITIRTEVQIRVPADHEAKWMEKLEKSKAKLKF
eukprot:TRINITY_DN34_c0_g1_i7.p1 TRINITY_DN34_c0_g1~~TRINITY_DN34_c0_g1_i7.p1  ORF type:complete len:135 (+),score=34.23 TRINITY_DN34_c0_g1_i7:716-1120(+)